MIAGPPVAIADIYKWVDERGAVTYGNVPPAGAKKLTQLDEDNGRVSTVPGLSPEQLARQRELALAARVERLERELYELERARYAAAAAMPAYPEYAPAAYAYPAYSAFSTFYPAYGYRFATRPFFARHPPTFARHPPVFARHPSVFSGHPPAAVRHAPARGMRR